VKILESLRSGLESVRQAVENRDVLLQQQQAYQDQLQALYASRSWRLTAPLRNLTIHLRFFAYARLAQARKVARHLLLFVLRQTGKHPALKRLLRKAVDYLPRVEAHLRCFVAHRRLPVSAPEGHRAHQGFALTPAAYRVYTDLKTVVEEAQSEGGG